MESGAAGGAGDSGPHSGFPVIHPPRFLRVTEELWPPKAEPPHCGNWSDLFLLLGPVGGLSSRGEEPHLLPEVDGGAATSRGWMWGVREEWAPKPARAREG